MAATRRPNDKCWLKVTINDVSVLNECVLNKDVFNRSAQLHDIFNTERLTREGFQNSITEHDGRGKLLKEHRRTVVVQSKMNEPGFVPEESDQDEYIENFEHSERFFNS